MATLPVIEDLDRCKIALQYVAEKHSASLTAVLELLLERLDTAIGEVHTYLRQCTCQVHTPQGAPSVPAHPGVLTLLPTRRQTLRRPAPEELQDRDAIE
jgi:hypothetical protein